MVNVRQTLEDLIRIDSNYKQSNRQIIEFIAQNLSHLDTIRRDRIDGAKLELYNLVVRIPGVEETSPLVFACHTDTVTASGEWQTNALQPIEKGGRIYGLGACDMKAGLTATLCAALSLQEKPPQSTYLIFDADEEDGLRGARDLVKKFSLKNARVIVPEPCGGKIITGHNGCMDLRIEIPGEAQHSSLTNYHWNMARNANYRAVRVLNALIEYDQRLLSINDPIFGSPCNNIGIVRGGAGPTKTADLCVIELSRRVLPSEDMARVLGDLSCIIYDAEPDAKISRLFWGEQFTTPDNTAFITAIKNAAKPHLGEVISGAKPSWNETAIYARWGEAAAFGPGNNELAHKPNEFVEIAEVEKFTEIYKNLMLGK